MIVDAHLDLAYNAVLGRDVTLPATQQSPREPWIPSVGLPDLKAGGVALVCGTIFCEPAPNEGPKGYHTPEEARELALEQLGWYRKQVEARQIEMVRAKGDLPGSDGTLKVILLMEGADPLRGPEDVAEWFDAGLRMVGLAWKRTRYAGGTGAPGGLTPEGRELVRKLDEHRIVHDVSHLAEQSFWDLLDLSRGPVAASHSNCRAIIPTDRHLSDEMIQALVARGGVIGVNFYDRFLLSPAEQGKRRATLADVVRQVQHICDLAGDTLHVGLGTDMDGGFGADRIPTEISTSADLPLVADALAGAGFTSQDTQRIMAGNWLRFFEGAL
jgi:membrane dipeptidase